MMGTKTTISASVDYGLAMQFKKKAEELDLAHSAFLRSIVRYFLALPNDEQWKAVEEAVKASEIMELASKKNLLKQQIEEIEKKLKEKYDFPVKDKA